MNDKDIFIGLDSFGMSGPGKEVLNHFGICVEKVLNEARKILNRSK